MWSALFIQPFLIAFALTIVFSLLLTSVHFFQDRWRLRERKRSKRTGGLSRFGGLAMMAAFFLTCFTDPHLVITPEFYGLFGASALVFLFGTWDDIAELGWKAQIFFQSATAIVLFVFGMRILSITNPFGGVLIFSSDHLIIFGFLLLFFWVLLIMNSINWLDGLDGLCGSVSFITFVTSFLLCLKPEVHQPPIAILSAIGAGVSLGFLVFNIHPARILAGTAGSMFLGIVISVLAVIAGTKIATAFLVLALPIADAFFVIAHRLFSHASIFESDDRHLHYQLVRLGWSEKKITLFFASVTACIAIIALHTAALGKFFAVIAVLVIVFSVILFVHQRVRRIC